MNERVSPFALTRLRVDGDISEAMIMDVAEDMGVDTSDLIVYCGRSHAPYMRKIVESLGCMVVLVPEEIMNDQDHWAAHHRQRHEFGMWSPGA